jgi:type II secretory pathway component GspD/PulD (secretin)
MSVRNQKLKNNFASSFKLQASGSILRTFSLGLVVWSLWLVACGLQPDCVFSQEATSSGVVVAPANPELISLDLKGVDILELFKMLSVRTGLNIVPTKNVSGRVNLFVNNVSFDDVLDIVLVSNDLAQEKKGSIIQIMTATEYQVLYGKKYNEKRKLVSLKLKYAKPKDVSTALDNLKSDIGKVIVDEASGTLILMDVPEQLEKMQEMVKQLDQPLASEIFALNYAKAEDIEAKLSKVLSSPAHTIQIDKRTNKVMVTDLPQKMEEIRKLVSEFDEASRQVLIETDIWELSLTDRFQRGIDWEKIFRSVKNLDFKGRFPLGLAADTATTIATRQQISVGTVEHDDYIATIQFLSTYGKTEILSRPHLAVVNNEEAKILIGSKEAYITSTLSQAESSTTTTESVSFIDVGVKLNVVPSISRDGFITMKIKPEVSSVRETLTTSQGSRVPIVETSEVETTVKVKDGTTIMIAGLIKETKTETTTGIPVLSKIPVLNWFFSKYERGPSSGPVKKELIICITPRIITGEATVGLTKP